MTESQWVAELFKHLDSVFDILQGAIQLGVAASGGEEIHIEVNLYVGLNTHALITLFVY